MASFSPSRVAVIGTGNIGTDLIFKVRRSKHLHPAFFVGRNLDSRGMGIVKELDIPCSAEGISFLEDHKDDYDYVFDATSASSHRVNNDILRKLGKVVIDLTPAKIGKYCIPSVNMEECLYEQNLNLVTCGGQACIPIIARLSKVVKNIEYIEVVSSISSASAGIATRENIDEYLVTTEHAIKMFSTTDNVKAILNINPAIPYVHMQTSIYVKSKKLDIERIYLEVEDIASEVRRHVPGYQIVVNPEEIEPGLCMLSLTVIGKGDYLPESAGNLDIINCAAIAILERRHSHGEVIVGKTA